MKRFTFILFCFSLRPVVAFSEITTVFPALLGRVSIDHSNQVATGYELVRNAWPKAKSISEKSIKGWYEGRCYFRDRPNQPIAALLVVSAQESNLHGDIKGLMSRKSIVQVMNRDSSAVWFENLTQKVSKKIETLARKEQLQTSFAYESQGADFGLVVDFYETDARDPFRLTLRRDGSRIFSTTTCAPKAGFGACYDQSRPGRMQFVAYRGESAQYCYYFRRIKK